MNKEIIKQIIIAAIPLISTIISIYILPPLKQFIKTKTDKEDTEGMKLIFSSIIEFVDKMVKAMEQEHPDWRGEDKKDKVLELTINYVDSFFGVNLSIEDISFISEVIEGIVKEVKYPNDNNKMTFIVDSIEKAEGDDLK